MSDIRIDIDAITERYERSRTTRRDIGELIAEVNRQHEVNERWAKGWRAIVAANTEAWGDEVDRLRERVKLLESAIGTEQALLLGRPL